MKNILALGPFIGDFEQEILTFRPYIRWICDMVDFESVYVSTHSNRSFLYDFIPRENINHVFENLSRDELGQRGYIHTSFSQKDFNLLIKKFIAYIMDKESCNRKEIDIYHLSYVKSTPPYPIYKKVFEKIEEPDVKVEKKDVIFIPDNKEEDEERLCNIFDYLQKYNSLLIGDMKTKLLDSNVVLRNIDYFENGWKYILKYISEAKVVICPLSHWTTICNLQKVPVFSWGQSVGQYKQGGVYHLNNEKSMAIPATEDTENSKIIEMIKYFLKRNL